MDKLKDKATHWKQVGGVGWGYRIVRATAQMDRLEDKAAHWPQMGRRVRGEGVGRCAQFPVAFLHY